VNLKYGAGSLDFAEESGGGSSIEEEDGDDSDSGSGSGSGNVDRGKDDNKSKGWRYWCQCQEGWKGRHCRIRNGWFVKKRQIMKSFDKIILEIPEVSPCSSSPCPVNTECREWREWGDVGKYSYKCLCKDGFIGSKCNVKIKPALPCAANPCSEHGKCKNVLVRLRNQEGEKKGEQQFVYNCQCARGYLGKNCQVRITLAGKFQNEK